VIAVVFALISAAAAIFTIVKMAAVRRQQDKDNLSPWLSEFYSRPRNRKELK